VQPDLFTALITYCLVTSITPGPNNMMLLGSGVTFGFQRTIPHMLGISAGCALMVLILGMSLAAVTRYLPMLHTTLHIVSTLYLLWLAWRIATSTGPGDAGVRGQPLSPVDAAAFQWVNPKAWAMVLGAITSFAQPERMVYDVPVIAVALIIVGLPCIALWAGMGSAMRTVLREPKALRIFNFGMAALLVVSILPGLQELI